MPGSPHHRRRPGRLAVESNSSGGDYQTVPARVKDDTPPLHQKQSVAENVRRRLAAGSKGVEGPGLRDASGTERRLPIVAFNDRATADVSGDRSAEAMAFQRVKSEG